jgi:hypothetical protein
MKIKIKTRKIQLRIKPKKRAIQMLFLENLKPDMLYRTFVVPFTFFASEVRHYMGKELQTRYKELAPNIAKFGKGAITPDGYKLLEVYPDCRWAIKSLWIVAKPKSKICLPKKRLKVRLKH